MILYTQVLLRFLTELVRLSLQACRWPDSELFLQAVYRACLKRDPDIDGKRYYMKALERKTLDWWGVLHSVLRSNEFRSTYYLPVHPLNAVHQARMMMVQRLLPPADVILDLGGAAEGHPEGALLAMGYPHRPSKIIIVDLMPAQARGMPSERIHEFVTSDGVHVYHHYGSMTDLSWIPEASVDLVYAGQSIEHITEAEAYLVCQEVYRILGPGGHFCVDTPNAALARLQSPDSLINPDHKKEYYVHELLDLLTRAGFKVVDAKGICPMPHSLQQRAFDLRELVRNIGLSESPEESYLFFLHALKPGL